MTASRVPVPSGPCGRAGPSPGSSSGTRLAVSTHDLPLALDPPFGAGVGSDRSRDSQLPPSAQFGALCPVALFAFVALHAVMRARRARVRGSRFWARARRAHTTGRRAIVTGRRGSASWPGHRTAGAARCAASRREGCPRLGKRNASQARHVGREVRPQANSLLPRDTPAGSAPAPGDMETGSGRSLAPEVESSSVAPVGAGRQRGLLRRGAAAGVGTGRRRMRVQAVGSPTHRAMRAKARVPPARLHAGRRVGGLAGTGGGGRGGPRQLGNPLLAVLPPRRARRASRRIALRRVWSGRVAGAATG